MTYGEDIPDQQHAADDSETSAIFSLADGRIVVEAEDAGVSVHIDDSVQYLGPVAGAILLQLAGQPDRYISQEAICENVYGYTDPGLFRSVTERIGYMRRRLGEHDLGDQHAGAIRTGSKLGFIALSSLDPGKVGIPSAHETVYPLAGGRVEVNPGRKIVRVDNAWFEGLSATEYAFLAKLAAASPKTVTEEDLLEIIGYSVDPCTRHNLEVIIERLRHKLGKHDLGDRTHGVIRCVHNIGYLAIR